MSPKGSVSHLLDELKAGHPDAAEKLWGRYFHRLVGLARKKLGDRPRRMADEEDVALNALDSFIRRAERQQFRQLEDRNDLWQLLVLITARKVCDVVSYEQARGRGAVQVFADLQGSASGNLSIDQVMDQEPTPEFAALVAEECERLFERLGDETLRNVARLKMEGYTNEEIAAQLGWVTRTTERKLELIRRIWAKEAER